MHDKEQPIGITIHLLLQLEALEIDDISQTENVQA
jgi:hypothetical protein